MGTNPARPKRNNLLIIAVVPLPLLWGSVTWAQKTWAQKTYAILGSLFMPLLALTLLLMNNRTNWVGCRYRNGRLTNAVLIATLAFFGYVGIRQISKQWRQMRGKSDDDAAATVRIVEPQPQRGNEPEIELLGRALFSCSDRIVKTPRRILL